LDYDAFLLENPLHYEKWIDYANDENSLGSLGNAYYVYERALAILTHSVDLWVHYCKESINSDWPCDDIRNLFNRATLIVGSNYTASPLWNTIIGFETKQEDLKQLAMVYTTLFMHPIQHLDDYLIRCLIACAYLPEYWVRYVLCMHKRHWNHSVDELIDRATKLVFPKFITDSDVLTRLYQLLARDDTEGIQKGVCWIISRLTDGKGAQIEDVVGTEIYDKAINVLKMFWDEDEKNQNMVGMLFGSN
ncbi:unnamed protein product, partial [Brassica rapa]